MSKRPSFRLPVFGMASLLLMLVALLACASEATPTRPGVTLFPPPTATPETQGAAAQTIPLNAGDLAHLPDDPTELMFAAIGEPFNEVGRKMAYSHNEAFIPVIMEFMRFQRDREGVLTLASFLVRIRDQVPEEQVVIVPHGEDTWRWWQEWLAQNPDVRAPDGYDRWKATLFSFIDPRMGAFFYEDIPTTIRLEEIVWGGVPRDGIPDLQFPPVLTPEQATYLEPGDRIFGVSINGEHRAYPLRILNAHEMANDILGGVQFALAY